MSTDPPPREEAAPAGEPTESGGPPRGGRASGRRPPWWPASEPWPPRRGTWRGRAWGSDDSGSWAGPPWAGSGWGEGPWGRRRGGFMRRIGCLFAFVVLLALGAGAAAVWVIGTTVGAITTSPFGHFAGVAAVVLGVLLLVGIGRALRSFARPVDELVDAAGRVEDGDFSARVLVRGPGDVRSLARAFNAMSARLEETDRQRRASLADISHELRTPLTVIQGQLEAVIDGVYPADAAHLAPILDQVRTLDGLIEDLRTLTLVDSGALTLRREPVDMAVLVSDTLAALRPTATARGVELRADIPASLPVIDADPVRVRSVLSNLLTNAIRHTPAAGSVSVGVAVDRAVLRVRVHDTGPGFPPDLLPRAFERFARSADSTGSGLGLAIARDLVLAHGGTIDARNEADGATVEFALPLRDQPEGRS